MTTAAQIFLVSACASGEQFVAAFRRYADRNGLFVPIAEPLAVGRRGRFALTLKDGGVMIEGDAEVISAAKTPSVLHGRIGMTLRFTAPDEPSSTTLNELLKARLALKPVPPSIPPRPADVPASPRPVPPAPSGRIDAASALAECIAIGDGIPPGAEQRLVAPAGSSAATRPPLNAPRARAPSSSPVKSTQAVAVVPPPRAQTGSPVGSLEDAELEASDVAKTVDVATTLRDPSFDEVTHRGPAPVAATRAEPPTKPPPLPRTATPATPLPLTTTAPSNAVFEPAEPTTPGAAPPRLVDKPSGGHLRDQRTTVLGLPIVPGGVPVLPAPASSRSRPNRIEGEETTSGGAFSSPTTGSFTSAEPILDEPAFIEQPPPTDDWPAEPSRPSGNWSIALDPTRPDGWGDPAKMETPPEVEHAASDVIGGESDSAEMQALPMRLSEPKVQIDPTFIDSLPKLADDAFAPTLTEPTGLTATVPMTPISSRGMPAADDPALGDTLPRAARSRPLPGLPPPPVSATAATAPAFAPLPADYPMVAGDPPTVLVTPSKRKRTPMIVAGVAVLAAAGVATVLLTRGGDRAKPTVARTTQMPTHDPTPATRSPAAADHEAPEDPSERTTAPQATCKVQVVSVPKGAAISLDDKTLGTAPTTLSLPCGSPVKLVARRVRYAATTRAITPRPDATKPLVIKLQRATFAIKVSSTPQGAKIMLGRKLMGVTPTSIKLPGFSPVTLRIIKDGYGARTEKLIPKHNNQAVHVALKKAKRR